MQLNGRSERTITQPAPAPVSLEPRHEPLPLLLHTLGALVCLLVAWFGWWLCGQSLDAMQTTGAVWRYLGGGLVGGACVGGGAWGAWRLWSSFLREIEDVRQRRRDWHEQLLAERQEAGGLVVDTTRTEWSLRADQLRDVLLVALYVHAEVEGGADRPWSRRKLATALYLGGERQQRLIGELSAGEAEKVAATLEALGLIVGRGERAAGQWTARSAGEVVERVLSGRW